MLYIKISIANWLFEKEEAPSINRFIVSLQTVWINVTWTSWLKRYQNVPHYSRGSWAQIKLRDIYEIQTPIFELWNRGRCHYELLYQKKRFKSGIWWIKCSFTYKAKDFIKSENDQQLSSLHDTELLPAPSYHRSSPVAPLSIPTFTPQQMRREFMTNVSLQIHTYFIFISFLIIYKKELSQLHTNPINARQGLSTNKLYKSFTRPLKY